jgi:hypothetical protein
LAFILLWFAINHFPFLAKKLDTTWDAGLKTQRLRSTQLPMAGSKKRFDAGASARTACT